MYTIFTGTPKDLEDDGFKQSWYGLYSGDYLVEYEYKKEFWYKNKKYYFKCGRTIFGQDFGKDRVVFLYKDKGNKIDKVIYKKKIIEYGLQGLINKELITYVK